MPKTYMLIHSNPIAGKEKEYNEWYDKVHLPEIAAVEGVKAYQRFSFKELNGEKPSHQYLIRLELDSADPMGTVARMYAAQSTFHMEPVVDHDTLKVSIVQEATEEVRKN